MPPRYARPARRAPFTPSRKRASAAPGSSRPYKRARTFRPGFDRSVGFYGRYNRGELKFHDLDISFAPLATNGNIHTSLNLVAGGSTESTRLGRKITVRSIHMRFRVTMPVRTDASHATEIVRVMVMLDKQCNGAGPTGMLTADTWDAFNELANKNRFRTLYERTLALNTAGVDNAGSPANTLPVTRALTCNINLNHPIEFNGVTGAITEIRSNNFFLYVQTLQGTTSGTVLEGRCRVRYTDS